MADVPDPPRKNYGFKEREFKRDNPVGPQVAPMPSTQDLAKLAGPVTRTTPEKSGAKADDPNDVFRTLEQNRAREKQSGLDAMEIRQVQSRRRRDFWIVLVGGNAAIIGGVVVSGLNPITVIFGLAGIIIFSLSLAWIMFQVMNRY